MGCCLEVNDARVRRTEARSGAMVVDMFAGAISPEFDGVIMVPSET